ncbi:MAG TPA: hypothetical protein VLQ78_13825 [Ornithinibacter sp.]|nr:hypothetical protein [Ornithinibacter sp.]
MNRTTVSPAPARTDRTDRTDRTEAAGVGVVAELADEACVAGVADNAGVATDPAAEVRLVRSVQRRGYVMAAGALTWAATVFTVGTNPDSSLGITIGDVGGLAFQVGVMGLIGAMALTGALGTTRTARVMLRVERVLLSLAMLWTVIHGFVPAWRDATWLAVLDAFWPLSMLGMFVLGIKVLVAGRWRGVARVWPLVAESWAVVTVPTFVIIGEPVSNWVGGSHLLIGYTVLGLILARRTELVLPRR